MIRAVVRWVLSSTALIFVVTVLTFVLVSLAPGDAAKAILSGSSTGYSPEQYEQMRQALGINQPLPVQYWNWLNGLIHGSLGSDMFNGEPVAEALNVRIVPTLSIAAGTAIVSAIIGVALGVLSAQRPTGFVGRMVDAVSLFGLAAPNFWLALVLVELLAIRAPLFPAIGYEPPTEDPFGWLRSVALPVATLSAGAVSVLAKQTRDSMSEVLSRDFITMLHARGLSSRSIIYKHALRNAAIPVVTVLGLVFVNMLSGTVLVETIFGIPGLGQQAVTASGSHNLPMIEGVAFYFTIAVVIVNLLVDVSYRLINPRVRTS